MSDLHVYKLFITAHTPTIIDTWSDNKYHFCTETTAPSCMQCVARPICNFQGGHFKSNKPRVLPILTPVQVKQIKAKNPEYFI
jgi:hypothetical protein